MKALMKSLLRDLRAGGKELLFAALAYRLAAFVVLWPLVGVTLRAFVSLSGTKAVADQDILFFVLRPVGLVALIVVIAFALAVLALEQACLLILVRARSQGNPVPVVAALQSGWRRAPAVLGLSLRLVIQALKLAAPFLLVAGAVYLVLLREYDINYYLNQRPPVFWWAAGLVGSLLAGMLAVLLPRVVGWTLALPLLLFDRRTPREALSASVAQTAGRRWAISGSLAVWAAAMAALGALNLALCGGLGRLLVPLAGDALSLILPVVGGLVLLLAGGSLVVSVLQTVTFALLLNAWFDRVGQASPAAPGTAALPLPTASSRPSRWTVRRLLAGTVVLFLVAALVGGWLIEGVQTEDHALVIAHRGAAAVAPENTLASVRQAIQDRTDLVEIDVQETADGEVVVFHDSDFMKLAGVNLKIWDATWARLQEIDIGSSFSPAFSGERVPRLADVLALCKGEVGVDIELKYYGHDQQLEERVARIVEAAGMEDQVILMSLKYGAVRKMKALRPAWKVGLLAATAVGDLTRLEADFLAVNTGLAGRSFIERAHRRGRQVYVWTVNDPLQMSRLLSMGVDGLITDRPALARAVLEHRATLGCVERLLLNLAFWLDTIPDDLVQEAKDANREA